MNEQETDIEFLVAAFTYSYASMNQTFYLRKRDLKVIGVHIFDYSLISECELDYETGLTKEEEKDIKEAIIANEKGYDTHIYIPRLTKEQRFRIIEEFIDISNSHKEKLLINKEELIQSSQKYSSTFYKKGIKPGVEMEYLTNGIADENFKSEWTDFYVAKTRPIALEWLEKQKRSLQQNT